MRGWGGGGNVEPPAQLCEGCSHSTSPVGPAKQTCKGCLVWAPNTSILGPERTLDPAVRNHQALFWGRRQEGKAGGGRQEGDGGCSSDARGRIAQVREEAHIRPMEKHRRWRPSAAGWSSLRLEEDWLTWRGRWQTKDGCRKCLEREAESSASPLT